MTVIKTLFIALGLSVAATLHAAPFPSPNDWRDENLYFIFTDRFNDGDKTNNTAEVGRGVNYLPSSGNGGIHGGDLKGIEKKLDYIKALGATAIWITPIPLNAAGSAYHGYGAQDFNTLAPHLGTMADLSNMVSAAHARDIKVILDIVCNHGGDLIYSTQGGYPGYQAPPVGYNITYRNSNQYAPPFNTNSAAPFLSSIFHTNGNIGTYVDPEQIYGELSGLDDFRTETTYVRTNMVNVFTNWIGRADLDGFRVDTVKHVDIGFWQAWCPPVHAAAASFGKSNFFMFGEVFNGNLGDDPFVGSFTGTKGGGPFKLDSVLDYVLYGRVYSVFANASGDTQQIETHYNQIAANYDSNAWYRLVTFLDNHDNARFLNNAGNNTNRLAVALAFLYTSRGIPCLYYGTEQAFNGGGDPNNREDMFDGQYEQTASLGDNFNQTHPLFRLVAQLNNFRRNYPALRLGDHIDQHSTNAPGLFAYARRYQTQEVFVVFNTAGATRTLPSRPTIYPGGTQLVNVFNTTDVITVNSPSNTPPISVPATSAKIFIAQSQFQPLHPVVVSQSPAHGATNVASNAAIVLGFNKTMDTNSVQAAFATEPARAGNFTWNALRNTMTFTPSSPLGGTTNNVRIATNATDGVDGKNLFSPFESYFVTGGSLSDTSPPNVFISSPTDNATLAGNNNITGTAGDNIAVTAVEIQVDAGAWTTATGTTTWSYSLDSTKFLNGTHTISARATDAGGNFSALDSVSVKFFNLPGTYLVRVSPGNPSNVTDCAANVWGADQAYTLGSFGYSGGAAGHLNNVISNVCTAVYPLYQRERYSTSAGGFTYLFDCPAGVYETALHEAENWTNVPNGRVFNAYIEGQQVLTNFDIFVAAGGKSIPVTRIFTNAVADAQLEFLFTPVIDNARASGIQVRKIADLDSDSDGIPDWWMLGYFDHSTGQAGDNSLANQDADGDGMSNLAEFLSGTDPSDPNSALRITAISVAGDDLAITWTTRPNKTNQLERSDSLSTGTTWNAVGSLTIGTGNPATQVDPGAATNTPSFYRVRLLP